MFKQRNQPQAGLYEQLVALVIVLWLVGQPLLTAHWPFSTGLSWDLE